MVIDSGLQLILIWSRLHRDTTLLPSRFGIYRRFGSLSSPEIKCKVHIRTDSKSPIVYGDLAFLGEGERILGLLQDMEGTGTKSLNRLAMGH